MHRIPEPELMDDDEQARAYAEADFSEPHQFFVTMFKERFPGPEPNGRVIDLGCGPADVTIRFARAFPRCRIDGVDGAAAMLRFGLDAVRRADLEDRIRLIAGVLPDVLMPADGYDAVISNSLLHHLADPMVLWESVKRWGKPGSLVFMMDLLRPDSAEHARRLVTEYAEKEPDVLRRDFHNSLCAAYRPEEIQQQLDSAGLAGLTVRIISDRHQIVAGRVGG